MRYWKLLALYYLSMIVTFGISTTPKPCRSCKGTGLNKERTLRCDACEGYGMEPPKPGELLNV